MSYLCPYCRGEMKFSQSFMADIDLYSLSCINHIQPNLYNKQIFNAVSFNFAKGSDNIEFQSFIVPFSNLMFYSWNLVDKVPYLYISYNHKINLDITWLSLSPEQIINKAKLLLNFI